MENAIVKVDATQIVAAWEDPQVLIKRRERMVQLMTQAMKEGQHFGKVPGCKQNSLFQPGSQLLSVSFKIGHEPFEVKDLSTSDEKCYRVTDRVFDQITGITLGYGIGECSSSEEKYSWKRCYIDEEFEATPFDRKKIKFYKNDQGKVFENKMVRTNPSDVANTILKMARKRANVNGTIEVLAASDVFTQDLEDLPEGMDIGGNRSDNPKAGMSMPTEASQGNTIEEQAPSDEDQKAKRCISSKQQGLLYGKCKEFRVDPEAVKNFIAVQHKVAYGHFWLVSWSKTNKESLSEFDRILKTISEQPDFFQKYAPVKTVANGPTSPANTNPTQTITEGANQPQTNAEPSEGDKFEIAILEIAESFGKTVMDASIELQKAFKVDDIRKIPAKDRPEAIKHLKEVF